jgi:lipopolysaccharide transport system ATP-binding protein
MSDVVIRAEGLGKKYVIGHQAQQERNPTLRDMMTRTATGYLRSAKNMLRGQQLVSGDEVEEFWALKDVSFDIKRGDVVGIIGRNGAGKSTLLKVLSRITEPSEGRVEIRGRVASLLEVGTGFHPELTGRENIYLNGAILGMTRAEIKRKFDEIVDFAEIEKFLDTPVKRYSSGMYVRLAFAVAAHLDPEILIVDEVLAVGDAQFQKKCLGKMKHVAGGGRTVLFVSHNLASMSSLTGSCIHMREGRAVNLGPTQQIIGEYLAHLNATGTSYRNAQPSSEHPSVESAEVHTALGGHISEVGQPLTLRFGLRFPNACSNPCFSFQIMNWQQLPVVHGYLYAPELGPVPAGICSITCTIPQPRLNIGDYSIRTYLTEPPGGVQWEVIEDICQFRVVRSDSPPYWGWRNDVCTYFEDCVWSLEEVAAGN